MRAKPKVACKNKIIEVSSGVTALNKERIRIANLEKYIVKRKNSRPNSDEAERAVLAHNLAQRSMYRTDVRKALRLNF